MTNLVKAFVKGLIEIISVFLILPLISRFFSEGGVVDHLISEVGLPDSWRIPMGLIGLILIGIFWSQHGGGLKDSGGVVTLVCMLLFAPLFLELFQEGGVPDQLISKVGLPDTWRLPMAMMGSILIGAVIGPQITRQK